MGIIKSEKEKLDIITKIVTRDTGIGIEVIAGDGNSRQVSQVRKALVHFLRAHTNLTYDQIGETIKRDRSTACRLNKINKTSPVFRELVSTIEKSIGKYKKLSRAQ